MSNSVLNLTFSTVEPPIDECKLSCEICKDQQSNNSLCQMILKKCNNCMEGQNFPTTISSVSDGGVSIPMSLHKNDDLPAVCYDWACQYCESVGGNDFLCQTYLSKCKGCKFFYGVPNPGRK